MDNDTTLEDHFSLSPGYLCHDACATFPFKATSLDDGVWHHLALTWSLNTTASLYLDGALAYRLAIPTEPHPLIPGGIFTVGQDTGSFDAFSGQGFSGGQPPHGQLDSIRMWGCVRSAGDVVASMYAAFDAATSTALAASSSLLFSFDFDTPANISTTAVAVGTGSSLCVQSVRDGLGNTLYGGCLNCTGTSWLPVLTTSDCPVVGPYAHTAAKVEVGGSRVLVPLPFTAYTGAPCNTATDGALVVTPHLASLPFSGSLWKLDNATAVTVGMALEVFNGTRHVPVNATACAILGAALLLFQAPAGSLSNATRSIANFTYTVTVTNATSGATATSSASTALLVREDAPVLVTSVVPSTTIGAQNVFSVGVVDPGALLPSSPSLCGPCELPPSLPPLCRWQSAPWRHCVHTAHVW